ncbi:MAG TPA: maltotransferase domain-containing protein, partial [Jiangellales bacterium]|nr:maltotransferase domain-containing protein [Jiangellales bacterium]
MTGRIPILDVEPTVACGAYPAKVVVGEAFEISATVFREGHDAVNANVVLTDPSGRDRGAVPMQPGAPGLDRWHATVSADEVGTWGFSVEGWGDPWATWHHTAEVKVPAGIDVELVFAEAAQLLERAAKGLPRGTKGEKQLLRDAAKAVRDTRRPDEVRLSAAFSPDVTEVLQHWPLRDLVTRSGPHPLLVERERALYGSWYEFFPRSEGAVQHEDGS